MLTLYYSPGSSSMAVHIALHEIGVPFESRPFHLPSKEQRAPAYLALNPEGKVPTLLIDGRPLTEVAAILYLSRQKFPAAGSGRQTIIEAEAQAISWMSFIASTIHPARIIGVKRVARCLRKSPSGRLAGKEWTVERYSMPTSTCSGSFGGSSVRLSRSLRNSPAYRPITAG